MFILTLLVYSIYFNTNKYQIHIYHSLLAIIISLSFIIKYQYFIFYTHKLLVSPIIEGIIIIIIQLVNQEVIIIIIQTKSTRSLIFKKYSRHMIVVMLMYNFLLLKKSVASSYMFSQEMAIVGANFGNLVLNREFKSHADVL